MSDTDPRPSTPNRGYGLLATAGRRPWIMVLVAAEVVVAAAVVWYVGKIGDVSGGEGILDASLGYSHSEVVETFERYGTAGLDHYRSVQLLDIVHPALYSTLLAALLFKGLGSTRRRPLALTPFLAGVLDYVENAFLWVMTETYPDISSTLVAVSSTISIVKRISLVLVFVAIAIAIGNWARNRTAGQ